MTNRIQNAIIHYIYNRLKGDGWNEKRKSMSFICTLFCLLLGIVIFLGMSLCVYAEGSRDLINSAAGQGDRAYIEYQGDNMLSVGLQRQQYVNVYM